VDGDYSADSAKRFKSSGPHQKHKSNNQDKRGQSSVSDSFQKKEPHCHEANQKKLPANKLGPRVDNCFSLFSVDLLLKDISLICKIRLHFTELTAIRAVTSDITLKT
jgi:hypothetical protein